MGSIHSTLSPEQIDFIRRQHLFFTASAPLSADARINLSPKGIDSFRILSPSRVAYLDLTGSGNETAAHIRENRRLTIMFCAFHDKPLILRLYGQGDIISPRHADWPLLASLFPSLPGIRQIIALNILGVQASCGFGVPLFRFDRQRDDLLHWAHNKGEHALQDYRLKKNASSIDGLPTGIA